MGYVKVQGFNSAIFLKTRYFFATMLLLFVLYGIATVFADSTGSSDSSSSSKSTGSTNIVSAVVEYTMDTDDEVYEGRVVYDEENDEAPGLLIYSAFVGPEPSDEWVCRVFVAQGFFCFIADLLTKDVRPTNFGAALAQSNMLLGNTELLHDRMKGAVIQLLSYDSDNDDCEEHCNFGASHHFAAMGYALGADVALELAREQFNAHGAGLRASVGFYSTNSSIANIIDVAADSPFDGRVRLQYHHPFCHFALEEEDIDGFIASDEVQVPLALHPDFYEVYRYGSADPGSEVFSSFAQAYDPAYDLDPEQARLAYDRVAALFYSGWPQLSDEVVLPALSQAEKDDNPRVNGDPTYGYCDNPNPPLGPP